MEMIVYQAVKRITGHDPGMADTDILIAVLVRVYMILIRNIDAGSNI